MPFRLLHRFKNQPATLLSAKKKPGRFRDQALFPADPEKDQAL